MSHPCLHCGTTFPHDAAHFYVHKRDGLTSICKDCRAAQVRHGNDKAKARRKNALKKIEASAVDLYSKLAAAGGSNIPHTAEMVEKICEYFGGVSGFAAIVVKQYYDAKPGSSPRNKLIETVFRLIQGNVDSGGAKKPLTLWTEEELEAELQDRFRTAVLAQRKVIDAEETPAGHPAAEDSDDLHDDAASGGEDQGTPRRIEGPPTGGSPAVPADGETGAGPPVPVE